MEHCLVPQMPCNILGQAVLHINTPRCHQQTCHVFLMLCMVNVVCAFPPHQHGGHYYKCKKHFFSWCGDFSYFKPFPPFLHNISLDFPFSGCMKNLLQDCFFIFNEEPKCSSSVFGITTKFTSLYVIFSSSLTIPQCLLIASTKTC